MANNYRKNNSKQFLVLQTILRVVVILTLGFAVYMAYFIFANQEMPALLGKFGPGLAIFLVGVIAFFLPILNKMNLNTSDRGDNMMKIVGIILMILGIGTIIFNCIS